jgi:hypothetical protein
MSKTSTTVKDRYNARTYDNVFFRVPKGGRAIITNAAKAVNKTSASAYIAAQLKADGLPGADKVQLGEPVKPTNKRVEEWREHTSEIQVVR